MASLRRLFAGPSRLSSAVSAYHVFAFSIVKRAVLVLGLQTAQKCQFPGAGGS